MKSSISIRSARVAGRITRRGTRPQLARDLRQRAAAGTPQRDRLLLELRRELSPRLVHRTPSRLPWSLFRGIH
jgi:hypothetical protein